MIIFHLSQILRPEANKSKTNPEEVDTHASDHAYDALRYMIMSRPRMENPLERLRGFKRDMFKPADSDFGYW